MLFTERATRGAPRAFVRYEDLLDDWTRAVAGVGDRLDLDVVRDAPAARCARSTGSSTAGSAARAPTGATSRCRPRCASRPTRSGRPSTGSPTGEDPEATERLDELRGAYVDLYAEAEAIAQSSIAAAGRGRAPAPAARVPAPTLRLVRRVPRRYRHSVPLEWRCASPARWRGAPESGPTRGRTTGRHGAYARSRKTFAQGVHGASVAAAGAPRAGSACRPLTIRRRSQNGVRRMRFACAVAGACFALGIGGFQRGRGVQPDRPHGGGADHHPGREASDHRRGGGHRAVRREGQAGTGGAQALQRRLRAAAPGRPAGTADLLVQPRAGLRPRDGHLRGRPALAGEQATAADAAARDVQARRRSRASGRRSPTRRSPAR